MKKVIDGKVYDTQTATQIHVFSFGKHGDYEWYQEELYQTKKGTFFMYAEGGAMSPYREQTNSNTISGGSCFKVMTVEQAKSWLEEKADAETYIEVFGEVEEG